MRHRRRCERPVSTRRALAATGSHEPRPRPRGRGARGALVTDAGDLRVQGSDVHVRAVEVGRANALPTRMFGFDVDVVLAFTDIGRSSQRRRAQVYTDVVRATLAATDVVGAHGVLFEDFDDDSLILRVDGGRLTLNDRWPGWRAWPEVLDVIPAPHRFAPLHMPR
jgi:hypothetical protein